MSLAPLELTLSFVHLSIKTPLCVLKKKTNPFHNSRSLLFSSDEIYFHG